MSGSDALQRCDLVVAVLAAVVCAYPAQAQAQEYWTCYQRLQGHGYSGSYWQWVESPDEASEVRVQIEDENGLSYSWSYSNRFTGPSYDKAYFGGPLLSFEDAFSEGPEYVGGLNSQFDHPALGELWAHYYGDGQHVLSEVLVSRKSNRRSFANRYVGLQHGIGHAAIAAMFGSRLWQVLINDTNGKVVARHTIVPVDFAEVRAQIARQAPAFEYDLSHFSERCSYDDGQPELQRTFVVSDEPQ